MTNIAKYIARQAVHAVNGMLHAIGRLSGDINSASLPASPIFIVGAPRTGSTILYQVLTSSLAVAYVDNFAAYFYGSLPLGIRLSRFFFRDRRHASFCSRFGDTKSDGLHAPSEFGGFWYRWLPQNDHFADAGAISSAASSHIRHEIGTAMRIAGAPILFKNLHVGQRLQLLSRTLPEARIIWCRRDPIATIGSILRARNALGIPAIELWSTRPHNWRKLSGLDEYRLVAAQVHLVETRIASDIALFPVGQRKEVSYEEFMTDPARLVREMSAWLDIPIVHSPDALEVLQRPGAKSDAATVAKITESYSWARQQPWH